VVQVPPSDVQAGDAHWPATQELEQHSLACEHVIPAPLQLPAVPHIPLLHLVEQHCDACVHARPLLRQLGPALQVVP
jgi:hypothetical protein